MGTRKLIGKKNDERLMILFLLAQLQLASRLYHKQVDHRGEEKKRRSDEINQTERGLNWYAVIFLCIMVGSLLFQLLGGFKK